MPLKIDKFCKSCGELIEKGRSNSSQYCNEHSGTAERFKRWWEAKQGDELAYKRKVISRLKFRSKELGLPFNLTVDDIDLPEFCPIFGVRLNYHFTRKHKWLIDDAPTIDRIIPEKGYIKGNIQTISNRANRIKDNASLEELLLVVEYLRKSL